MSLFRKGNVTSVENVPGAAQCSIAHAAANAMRNWGTSFPRPERPRLRFWVILT